MTLDAIIEKYGTHDLDVDYAKTINNETLVYACCQKQNPDNSFSAYFLEIKGYFHILEKCVADKSDISIHAATIEKNADGSYEVGGVGDWFRFRTNGELSVNELSRKKYEKQIHS